MQDFPVFRPENYRAFNSRIHYSKSPQHLSSTVYSSTPPKYNSTVSHYPKAPSTHYQQPESQFTKR